MDIRPIGLALFWLQMAVSSAAVEGGSAGPRVNYVALGDSLTYGFGASRICAPAELQPLDGPCRDATNFPPLFMKFAGYKGASLQNLAVNGATLSDVLRNQIPRIAPDATLITLYVGMNDLRILVNASDGATAAQIRTFRSDLARAIREIRRRSPRSRLILANVPNAAYLPWFERKFPGSKARLFKLSNLIDVEINRAAGSEIGVVDLLCDSRSYEPDRLSDGAHPNDAGYAGIAEKFSKLLATPRPSKPAARCAPYF